MYQEGNQPLSISVCVGTNTVLRELKEGNSLRNGLQTINHLLFIFMDDLLYGKSENQIDTLIWNRKMCVVLIMKRGETCLI